MGSLSNLYISQSYQSLIHLGTNNTASATLIGLEDGLGNSIGVSVNTAGNLFLSGTFSASLQEGYIYVGNSSGRTIAFPTSSFISELETGSLLTTASFNSYTSSNDQKVNSLISATGSYATTGSNTFNGSQIISGNLDVTDGGFVYANVVNANVGIQTPNIEAGSGNELVLIGDVMTQKGVAIRNGLSVTGSLRVTQTFTASLQQGYVWVGDSTGKTVTVATSSFIDTFVSGNLVTTASFNAYTSSNDQRVSSLEINSASVNTSITNINSFTQSANIRLNNLETTSASVNVSIANINSTTASQATSISNLNSFTQSQAAVNALLAGEIDILEAKTGSYATTGSNTFIGNQTITGNISAFSASFTYLQTVFETASVIYSSGSNQFGDELTDIQTLSGSVKVQGSLTINGVPVQTSSFDPSALNQATASLQAFTQSANIRLNNLESTSASVNTSITNLNSFTSSQLTQNSNLGTYTGSVNTFITSSAMRLDLIEDFTQSADISITNINQATASLFTSASLALVTASFDTGTRNLTFTKGNTTQFSVNIPDVSGSAGDFVTTASFNSYTQSNDQRVSSLEAATSSYVTSAITASSIITASVSDDDITFTKGDGSTFTIQVATGSFALSASYAETASIARNLIVVARNGGASTLGAGTVVHITSAVGDNPVFTTASYDTEDLSSNTFGLLRYSSPSGADVEVVVAGVVTGVDTDPANGYTAGDIVYLSSSGQFTRVQPQAPNQIVALGQVLRAQQNNGSIYVSINNGWELNELHNVQINNVQTGDLIQYESSSYGLWKNKSIVGAGITTTSSFNSYTSSNDQRVSSLEANSASVNTSITNINSATQSLNTSASLALVTASYSLGTITFTKGDGSTFPLSSFASLGANQFTGNQEILNNSKLIFGNGFQLSGNATDIAQLSSQTTIQFITEPPAGPGGTNEIKFINRVTGSSIFFQNHQGGAGNSVDFEAGAVNFNIGARSGSTGKVVFGSNTVSIDASSTTFTASLENGYAWVGNASGRTVAVATSSFTGSGGGTTYINPTLNPYSGSLILAANLTTTSSFSHITASNNGQVNLMFQNRNLTGQIYITGSSNIFSNPNTPSAGRLNYLGGSSNILLTSFTSNNTQAFPSMTGSTATIGGVYPAMNGNILMGQAAWTINPSNNPGIHNYNNNILNGSTTFNMLGNVATTGIAAAGRFDFTGNTSAGTILINSPSRSIAEINAGATGSFRLSMTNNNVQGLLTYNGPVSGSATGTHIINQNSIAGIATLNLQSQSRAYNFANNGINGNFTYTDNIAFTPTLGSSVSVSNNFINGVIGVTVRNSGSVNMSNNNLGGWQIAQNGDLSGITGAIQRRADLSSNFLGGVLNNNLQFSGSASGAQPKLVGANILFGTQISASVGGGEEALIATAVVGAGLQVFGTSIYNAANVVDFGANQGSAFFGRWNAVDVNKARTAETVFAVGTGNSGSAGITRKTGFLIDSGSNTFIEGTLNVSGASTLNGNTIITGSLTLSSSAAIELDVIGNSQFTGSLTVSGSTIVTGSLSLSNVISFAQLDPLPTGADGQLAVSASNLWFYSGSAWNRVAFA